MHMKHLYIKTHGCQMNQYDSEKIAAILHETHGLTLTEDPKQADVILINTCSVREKPQEKLYAELGRWRLLKNKRPELLIGVGGCVASQEGKAILHRAPFVDIIFGPQTIHQLPALLNATRQKQKPMIDTSFPEIEKFDRLPEPRSEGASALISIMEGCSKYCSFCVVPYTRGEEFSRPFDDVITEIFKLSEQGVREITLLGQNVNDYRGLMHDGKYADLALLIHYIAAMDAIQRIRFITSHPSAFSDHLITAYAEEPKLANHLHLPVQSGSDRILAAMKRNYTVLEFKSKIKKLRRVRPDISLSSDFIVGFPGETDADFEATLRLVRELEFDHSYSFIYSKRPGTPAATLPDPTPMSVKKTRLKQLQDQLTQQTQKITASMLGTKQRILVAGTKKTREQLLYGQSDNNRMVHFYGSPSQIGTMVSVQIEHTKDALSGTIIDSIDHHQRAKHMLQAEA